MLVGGECIAPGSIRKLIDSSLIAPQPNIARIVGTATTIITALLKVVARGYKPMFIVERTFAQHSSEPTQDDK